MTTQAGPPIPTGREWLSPATLTVRMIMIAIGRTVLFMKVPAIAATLGPRSTH